MTIHCHTKKFLYFLAAAIQIILVIIILKYNNNPRGLNLINHHQNNLFDLNKKSIIRDYVSVDNEVYNLKKEWFFSNCLENRQLDGMSLEDLQDYLNKYAQSTNLICQKISHVFQDMFELEVMYGEIKLNEIFKKKVRRWLDNNPDYMKQIYNQKIVKLYNKFYHDEMIYNGIRGKRPTIKQLTSEKNYTMNLIKESMKDCDFCGNNYKTNTASETFERIETKLTYTSANTFKYDKWHSLIVSRNHDTLFLSEEEIVDLFRVTSQWFKKVNEIDPTAIYPEGIWDAMPKSGASQIHTHLQASMGIQSYYGVMRRWLDASQNYFRETQRDFLDDFILIHKAFGLVYETNDIFLIVNLIPLKEYEVVLIANNDPVSNIELSKLVHRVIRIFVDKMEQYSFSAGFYFPDYSKSSDKNSNKLEKTFFRILFRPTVTTLRSDFNGLDLYTSSVISVDRYKIAKTLFNELSKK